MLELYRRHNPARCRSTDTVRCDHARRGCPIWVRGTDAEGVYHREPARTRDWKVAQDRVRAMEETGALPEPPRPRATVEELRDRFIAKQESSGLTRETIRQTAIFFRQMIAFAKEKGLVSVRDFDLAALEELRKFWKVGDLVRQKRQERLKAVFRYALKHQMIDENPASELGKIKVRRAQVAPFTDDEMNRIVAAGKARGAKVYALILLMRYSGLRIGDATMLALESLEGDRLSLRTHKADTDVSVRLPAIVVDALRAFKPTTSSHFFWTGESQLHGLTNLYRNKHLRKVFADAKVAGAHPHRFRHTFASKLLSAGVAVDDVAALLGNSPAIVRKHYSKWIAERQQRLDDVVLRANGFDELERPKVVTIERRRKSA